MTPPTCSECDQYLTDINEGKAGLHYDYPFWICTNSDCSEYQKDAFKESEKPCKEE
jgi:hypothetical protein